MTETDTDDRWYVQFDSAEVRLMTLDEIQEAFEAGLIHEKTYLIEVGKSDWQTLADVAGLGGEEEEEDTSETEVTPVPFAAPQATHTPPQAYQQQAPAYTQPQGAYPQVTASSAQRSSAAAPMYPQAAGNAAGAGNGSWPPVAATRPATVSSPPLAPLGPQSTIPVVQDVGLDLDLDPSFKSGTRNLVLFAAVAVAMVGGGGYALTRLDMPETPIAAAASLPAAPMPRPAQPSTPSVPTPAPESAPTPSPAADSKTASSGNLSDDMKRALLAQDKNRTQKKKSRAAASSGKRRASASSGTVLKGGGGADDPLDPSL